MTVYLPIVLAWCALLAPGRDHTALAMAIGREALTLREAALATAVAFRESLLTARATGGSKADPSWCAFQIARTGGGTAALNEDLDECTRKGLAMLRTSGRVCRSHPVAWYAEGPTGCESTRAQGISRDRVALSEWLLRQSVTP